MIRFAVCASALCASVSLAAPVPKEARAPASHVGTWQRVQLDPGSPAKRTPIGQTWIVGEDGNVAFQNMDHRGPPPKPTERLVFDPKTGEIDQSFIGGNGQIRKGRFRIDDDLLTLNLNNRPETARPAGLSAEPGSSIWTLQRVKVEEKK